MLFEILYLLTAYCCFPPPHSLCTPFPFLSSLGSHAASLQADSPTQLDHIRSVMDMYMTQVKDSANKALDQLDDTEYAQLK